MADQQTVEYRDDVAVLTLNRPPANALAPSSRRLLLDNIEAALANPEVTAIVIRGAGPAFCPGVDLGEYGGPLAAPWVDEICNTIEDAPKPVVVAIHGLALGAGFEIALAAHGRVAQTGTKVGMPEVTLGLVPGGGGTQRLPRIIGAQVALEIMLSGRTVDVGHKRVAPVFDRVVAEPPLEAAIRMARRLAKAGSWTRTRDMVRGLSDPNGFRKSVAEVEGKLAHKASAEAHIATCIEAAQLLPFEQGLEFEASRFRDSMRSHLAQGIRHSFTAVRRAGNMPESETGRPHPVKCVGLVGTAPVLGELALMFADRGLEVVMVGQDSQNLETRINQLRAVMDRAVQNGHATATHRDEALQRVSSGTDPDALAQADLVLDLGAMPLDQPPTLKPEVVWAVLNQVRNPVERAIEAGTEGRTVGLRVYRPAESRKLIELVVPKDTAADAVMTVMSSLAVQDRSVVRTVDIPGMLGLNLMAAVTRAGLALVAAGADPFEVDRAAMDMGLAMGPFRDLQEVGMKPGIRGLRKLCTQRGEDGGAGLKMAEAMLDPKQGLARFYEGSGPEAPAAGDVDGWLQDWRAQEGPDTALPEGITYATALLAALVNEGGRLVGARAVLRASDIDVVMLQGFGFDRKKGGPLLQADLVGLLTLVRRMKELVAVDAEVWTPCDHVDEMIKYGRRFF